MFTIEHDFDATVITLLDEGRQPLEEDVVITIFTDCATIEQYDPRRDAMCKITLSLTQMRDLAAALDLPEGIYRTRFTHSGLGKEAEGKGGGKTGEGGGKDG